MKKSLGMLVILSIVLFTFNAFAFQNEPDGFRGIKWGTNIKTFKDMIRVGKAYDGCIFYDRHNDKLQLGTVDLQGIYYYFWDNKFAKVRLITSGYDKFQDLREMLLEIFGKTSGGVHNRHYEWGEPFSGKTYIHLNYEVGPREIVYLTIFGVDVSKEKRDFYEQQTIMIEEKKTLKRKAKAKKALNDF